ncbi:T9SS type A sorting domain-containing protein [Saccharicrinis aurantiacus]|uniref:T9SS type A sorting domain-containing protein n=1 Tax=Saccharicrinis aurantiacus TaxID=1849719 RepID=UPI0024917470|nr:T9SS type A sorting domain-containing protein [Saccharicrinis aurantiacus]
MKKRITLILTATILAFLNVNAQDILITDFESPIDVTPYFGASFETISNPSNTGLNTSNTCGQFGRNNTNNWYALVDIPCNFTVPAGETRYLHMMVNYQDIPAISIRINNNTPAPTSNAYTNRGEWQDLVFEYTAGATDIDVTYIRVLGDVAYTLPGYVFNGILVDGKVGLIDEIIVNSESEPRSTSTSVDFDKSPSQHQVYSRNSSIIVKTGTNDAQQIKIFNSTGALVYSAKQISMEYNVAAKGLYIVKVGTTTQKLIVQ